MKSITWKTEKRKVSDLIGADYNPRQMSEQEERDLEESIDEFGTVIPIVVNIGKRKNTLIGGHQRTKLYMKRGIEEVDVMVPSRELSLEEEKRLNLRLNKNVGSWDIEKLKDMDLTLLLEVGFGDEDLTTFFDDVEIFEDMEQGNRGPKTEEIPVSKPGDLYKLGDHRVMCGDSTNPGHVQRLVEDRVALVFADAPKVKPKEYADFVNNTLNNALEHVNPNAHIFYWTQDTDIYIIQQLFQDKKIKNERVLLWIKNNFNLKPVAFNSTYQPCVYGTIGKPAIRGRKLNDILNKEIEVGNQVHEDIMDSLSLWIDKQDEPGKYSIQGQLPVTLVERPLKQCTTPGDKVLDLFGGTGSLLIACEQLKRTAYVMEKDPRNVDLIVQRWEEFTNKKAKKI